MNRTVSIGRVIAERNLKRLSDQTDIVVRIGEPQRFSDSDDYYCPYEILGLHEIGIRRAGGVDAIQALELALRMIGADLHTSPDGQNKNLWWSGGGSSADLGFPLPKVIADLVSQD